MVTRSFVVEQLQLVLECLERALEIQNKKHELKYSIRDWWSGRLQVSARLRPKLTRGFESTQMPTISKVTSPMINW